MAAPRRAFPPSVVVEVKALACELPKLHGKPLSRFSMAEIRRAVIERGLVAEISGATLWRWLDRDAIRPWRYRSWIFPRDPQFAEKAGRVLDLYEGRWENKPLGPKDFVLSADEKTSIQARRRCHPSLPPAPGRPMRVEHEYERGGALGVHRRVGCSPRQDLRPLRADHRDRPVRPPGRSGHVAAALPFRPPRLLGRGQRLLPSRRGGGPATAGTLAHHRPRSHAGACQLAQPESRSTSPSSSARS